MLIYSEVCKLSVMCVCVSNLWVLKIWPKQKINESTDKSLGGKFSIKLDLELYYWLECEKENNVASESEFREKGKFCVSQMRMGGS